MLKTLFINNFLIVYFNIVSQHALCVLLSSALVERVLKTGCLMLQPDRVKLFSTC